MSKGKAKFGWVRKKAVCEHLLNTCKELESQHSKHKDNYLKRDAFTSQSIVCTYGVVYERTKKVMRGVHYIRHMINVCTRKGTVLEHPEWDRKFAVYTIRKLGASEDYARKVVVLLEHAKEVLCD